MRVLNDFRCDPCGSLYVDQLVDNEAMTIACQHCDGLATKVRSVPNFILPGNDPGYPTAYDQWAKRREVKMAQERKLADPNP